MYVKPQQTYRKDRQEIVTCAENGRVVLLMVFVRLVGIDMDSNQQHWNIAFGLVCPVIPKNVTLKKVGSWQPEPVRRDKMKVERTYISRDEYKRMGREIVRLLNEGVTDVLSHLDEFDITRKAKRDHLKRYRDQLGMKILTKKERILHFKSQGLGIDEIVQKTGISLYYVTFIYCDYRRK